MIILKVRKDKKAFTLIEIVTVIVILAIVGASGARLAGMADDARLYGETTERLIELRDRIIGDERLLQSGRRADFGHYGFTAAFETAANMGRYSYFWDYPDPFIYGTDAWGNPYTTATAGGFYTVTSGASTRVNAGALANDISIRIRTADYTNNTVVIFFKDVHGTLLLTSVDTGGGDPSNSYHIQNVEIHGNGQRFDLPGSVGWTGAITVDRNGYVIRTGVQAGHVLLVAYPANMAMNTTNDWVPHLSSLVTGSIEIRDVVYPKGGFTVNSWNVYEIRFPGSVSAPTAPTI